MFLQHWLDWHEYFPDRYRRRRPANDQPDVTDSMLHEPVANVYYLPNDRLHTPDDLDA